MTFGDAIRDALLELGAVDPTDDVPPEIQALGVTRGNAILDQWNAEQQATYNVTFSSGLVFTPLLSPHTIGPTGATFTVSKRPVRILGANVQLSSGTSLVNVPIRIRDDAWWLKQPVPNLQQTYPTDLYYSPDYPNGALYFWPTPTVAYGVQLEVAYILGSLVPSDTFTFPPGYQRAFTTTLAEDLAGPLTIPLPPGLAEKARKARGIIFANNNDPVRIRTWDAGMPGGSTNGGGYSWRSGVGGGR